MSNFVLFFKETKSMGWRGFTGQAEPGELGVSSDLKQGLKGSGGGGKENSRQNSQWLECLFRKQQGLSDNTG